MNNRNFLLSGPNANEVLLKNFRALPTVAQYRKKESVIGDWTIKPFNLNKAQGYFSNMSDMGTGIALLRDSTCWMSITPLEIESHLVPNSVAKGKTVIAGLGLGMITLSLLESPKVDKLIVLEIDQNLIDSFPELLDGKSKALWESSIESGRLEVLQADCKDTLAPEVLDKTYGCDYLWVDIWETLFDNAGVSITKALQRQIKAKDVGFWGMELEFIKQLSGISKRFSEKSLYKGIEGLGLPLTPMKFKGKRKSLYAEICLRAGCLLIKTPETKG